MILYNTLMGVCAGLGLILVAKYVSALFAGGLSVTRSRGYSAAFLVTGIPLTLLSLAMTLTWPLNVNPPVNIAFGEPSLLLGILLTVAGAFLAGYKSDVGTSMEPVSWVVFALGLVLASTSSAIFSYNLIGDAPSQEPITGQFKGWENTAFGLFYAVAALGCLMAPGVAKLKNGPQKIMYFSFMIAGWAILLFSVLNYRTHIGLLLNLQNGTNFRW